MSALVLGGDGLIGSAVARRLRYFNEDVVTTTRRFDECSETTIGVDLLAPPDFFIGHYDSAFLCAGIRGFKECEGNATTWRVNVDGVLHMGRILLRAGTFVVYVSTDAVMWSDMAYARQRAFVELGLQSAGDPAIVRCCKVSEDTAENCADTLIDIAARRASGIHHWPKT